MGLSFAIPVDVAIDVVQQLKTKGKVSRGWLGILIQDVNRELAESFGMKQPRGAVVLRVLPDSPAAKAGFKVGDVVVDFNGNKIIRSSDLPLAVGQAAIGSKSKVTVIREGKNKTLRVTIAELPSEEELAEQRPVEKGKAESDKLGLRVQSLTAEQRKQLELGKRGVVVRSVESGPGRSAGIRPGDVILMINNQDVTSAEQFAKLVKQLPEGKSVPVLIQRGDAPVFLPLKIPED
jgi:serine protease Do